MGGAEEDDNDDDADDGYETEATSTTALYS